VALGKGTVITAWERRTEIGALERAVSKSPLLKGPSSISKEAKERFP
jgi:hypothetical protein